jgi:acyl-CoA dehydrogenase
MDEADREDLMDFEIAEEHRMLQDLVANFVRDELLPLEPGVLAREAEGKGLGVGPAEHQRLDEVLQARWGSGGLDAPEDIGGADLPPWPWWASTRSWADHHAPTTLPPDSPNLRC